VMLHFHHLRNIFTTKWWKPTRQEISPHCGEHAWDFSGRDSTILDPKSGQFDSYNLYIPLTLTSAAPKSKLFSAAPEKVMDILDKEDVTMNNHHYGIYPSHFNQIEALTSFFDVLSTNKDRQGVEFVSTIESKKYPIFGSQWHPEKNDYEWGKTVDGIPKEAINHSQHAILVAQYTATFFVEQARKNSNKFATPADEDKALIYNYPATKTSGSFVQEYFFHF